MLAPTDATTSQHQAAESWYKIVTSCNAESQCQFQQQLTSDLTPTTEPSPKPRQSKRPRHPPRRLIEDPNWR